MQAKDAFHIGGTWVPAPGREPLAVIDPATEEQVSSVPAGHAVRAVGWGLPGRPGPGRRRRSSPAHRNGRRQRRALQPARPVRRLQAERQRARARGVRPRRAPRGELAPAVGVAGDACGCGQARARTCPTLRPDPDPDPDPDEPGWCVFGLSSWSTAPPGDEAHVVHRVSPTDQEQPSQDEHLTCGRPWSLAWPGRWRGQVAVPDGVEHPAIAISWSPGELRAHRRRACAVTVSSVLVAARTVQARRNG